MAGFSVRQLCEWSYYLLKQECCKENFSVLHLTWM